MTSDIFREDMLAGKVALVTGGGTGIGASIARMLGKAGAQVAIASRKASNIEPAVAGLSEELGREVLGVVCDIRDRDAVAAAVAQVIDTLGSLDILINNGGGQFMSPAEFISPNGWDAVVATNLTGTWNMTRAAADAWMLEHGGRILHITMLTERGFPGMVHSVSARSGVEAMTRTLAVEWAQRGILMNCVQPGFIASSGMKNYPDGATIFRDMQAEVPLKRVGTCADVARMITFLAGPGGDYITGQSFIIDGGRTLWGNTWPIPDPDDGLPTVQIPTEPWEEA